MLNIHIPIVILQMIQYGIVDPNQRLSLQQRLDSKDNWPPKMTLMIPKSEL